MASKNRFAGQVSPCISKPASREHLGTGRDPSGGHGILLGELSQLRSYARFPSQLVFFGRVAILWLFLVSAAWRAIVGSDCNTFSTHSTGCTEQAAGVLACGVGGRRRRRNDPGDDATSDEGLEPSERVAASYSRYSCAAQREESVADQQRRCREAAQANGHQIRPEFEFADHAVSGAKLRRAGLDALLAAAEQGDFAVLYLFSLSRLARESVITMPLLKRLVKRFRVRVVSVIEGIDSANPNWAMTASVYGIVHEQYLDELAANVLRGQEGVVLQGWSVGDTRFGYGSEPIPGSETGRAGRRPKPRMRYVVDPEAAEWVKRIFRRFVVDGWSLRQITRELNSLGAPKDHRATTKTWHHQSVANLLACPKYVGTWKWGRMQNHRDPETGRITQQVRDPGEIGKWMRSFPELRIIDDATFLAAQERLAENRRRLALARRSTGQFRGWPGEGGPTTPRHLLSGLLRCEECGAAFQVRGRNSCYLGCPSPARSDCSCRTSVRRELAERLIVGAIGRLILDSPVWRSAVLAETTEAWRRIANKAPEELVTVERNLAIARRRVENLIDEVENGNDDPDVRRRLVQRKTERNALERRQAELQLAQETALPAPSAEWVDAQLESLGTALRTVDPRGIAALRTLLGGAVFVRQVRDPGSKRVRLQGSFTIDTQSVIAATGLAANLDDPGRRELIVVDFVEPIAIDRQADQAKELYDANLPHKDIARRLGVARSRVTKLLAHWHVRQGLPIPDGRSRRGQTIDPDRSPPKHKVISDEAWAMCQQGVPFGVIAEQLHVDRNTITRAIRFWHESRNLPAPDGRALRKLRNASRRGEAPRS